MELKGKYATARVFTENIDQGAVYQIESMLNDPITMNTKVAIMPDVHAGKGSTIGTTIQLPENRDQWKVCPNVVGVDIGCSMRAVQIKSTNIDLQRLDQIVHQVVPAGKNVHKTPICDSQQVSQLLRGLSFRLKEESFERCLKSVGTLGGGNHYIELGKHHDEYWLTVHSGSRNLGVLVASHHQKIAEHQFHSNPFVRQAIIEQLKSQGRESEIAVSLDNYKKNHQLPDNVVVDIVQGDIRELAYLSGEQLEAYLNDIHIAQQFSSISRALMLESIAKAMNWQIVDEFESMHNYIDIQHGILRKGATSAQKGERLIIPLNMRDGSIFATGKGNAEWNYSAPHGAGRILSRKQAKERLQMDEYVATMKGVYTTSVVPSTLDESPFAYKNAQEIVDAIGDTATIDAIVKPIYNFKAK